MQHPSMVASTVVIGTVAVSAAALVGLGVVPGRQSADAKGDYRVVRVIDGESLYVQNADGEQFRVRLIGIDAADRGACGYGAASEHLATILAPGEVVRLSASVGKVDSPDHSGRFLRYVLDGDDGDGAADVGAAMINDGYAVARYDSRDGFGTHEKEALYRRLDESSMPADGCTTVTAGQAGQAGQGAASTSQSATREPSQSRAAGAAADSGAGESSPAADADAAGGTSATGPAPVSAGAQVSRRVDRSVSAPTPVPGGAPIPEPFPTAASGPAPIPEPSAIRSIPQDDPAPAPSRNAASATPRPVVPAPRTSAPTPARTSGPTSSAAASPTEQAASPTATPTNKTKSPKTDDTKRFLPTKETKARKWPWRVPKWSEEERKDAGDKAGGRADRDD